MKLNNKLIFFTFLVIMMLAVNTAYADNAITKQTRITSPGIYYLNNNITAPLGNPIRICCDNVTLKGNGFTLDGNGTGSTAIYVDPVKNVTIQDIIIKNFTAGISTFYSYNLRIVNNTVSSNKEYGISIHNTKNNVIINNTVNSNVCGISLSKSINTSLLNNTLNSNGIGISLSDSNSNPLVNNTINSTSYGINLRNSNNTLIRNNTVNLNNYGIYLDKSTNNSLLYNCIISSKFDGIHLYQSYNNYIINNSVINSKAQGISIYYSESNSFVGNIFNNTNNLRIVPIKRNSWSTTKEKGGGNYWFNPKGTGFSETHPDNDNDGFCDEPYPIVLDNIDYLPRLIDTQGPTFTVHIPSNNSIYNIPKFRVHVTARDASGVNKIISELGDSNTTLTEYLTYYDVTYDNLTDKNHSLTIYAFDNVGNRAVKKLWVVVDTTAPNVSINTPTAKVYNTTNIFINATANDTNGIKEVKANINGTNYTLNKNNSYYTLNETFIDGKYSLKVYAEDIVGNKNVTDEVIFSVDTTLPTFTVLSPVNKSILNVDRFIVNVTAVDASGIDRIVAELGDWNNTLAEYPTFYYLSYNSLLDKNYSLKLYVFDNAGNRAVKKQWIVIDTTAPNVSINTPTGTLKTNKFLINVSSLDSGSKVKEVKANITNGNINENITLTKTGDYYVAEKTLNDGTYLLNVTSTDNANNSNSTTTTFTIDTHVPSNNNKNNKIDASPSIESSSLRRTVSNSNVVYGSSFDKQLAKELKENIHSDDTEIDGDTIIVGGPIANRIANQYNDRFSIPVTNDNPGENRGIIQVISIPSGSSTVIQNYKLIYIAGSDRLGTEAALKYFETLTELPTEPIVVEWTSSGYRVIK
ncbi:parallel beta-helix repeat protein [Methanococcus voltae]|uniref:NosD domain-containing protein n=1 Tax=Methanococcus voltae TaxID=2188 RepID=UPI001AE6E143|nr:NosD domain-containing protein [Methanococcus voltae]MBP2144380.1 parallel beta-helix repeat protein [Methanococcus voltae]